VAKALDDKTTLSEGTSGFENLARNASSDVAQVFTLSLAGGSDAVAAGEGNALSNGFELRYWIGPLLAKARLSHRESEV
jgi:hypothetical protein